MLIITFEVKYEYPLLSLIKLLTTVPTKMIPVRHQE